MVAAQPVKYASSDILMTNTILLGNLFQGNITADNFQQLFCYGAHRAGCRDGGSQGGEGVGSRLGTDFLADFDVDLDRRRLGQRQLRRRGRLRRPAGAESGNDVAAKLHKAQTAIQIVTPHTPAA